MKEEINATKIGKYFKNKNDELTDKQIQKLTYYAYVWYYVKNKKKLFDEKPQAWIHGPVFRSLFDSMKRKKFFDEEDVELDDDITEFLDLIYKVYGKYSGNELEEMTHAEAPWQIARGDLEYDEPSQTEIEDKDILEYYGA